MLKSDDDSWATTGGFRVGVWLVTGRVSFGRRLFTALARGPVGMEIPGFLTPEVADLWCATD